ncbi:putative SOS response-associated peptidase YedK [Litoreibacter halocynthiae]|uniref:Abasic site processing protein n=1 Tax=Litoreibacter halocynthiae TaxID=1242689 RepID=A0A4R7LHN9_9RHOB|nr:SOS response-associated peptidase family protein [Litoreibacter halocynthiae]TDT74749.1 putative SOS response-associated peptidase YedK [Litoreibacter halocynthiae]
MCNLYSSTTATEAMRQLFDVKPENDRLGNARPLTAIWPKYDAPVVRLSGDGQRELLNMSWGFLTPKMSKKTGKPISPDAWNNARADKVASSGFWKGSFQERRCLVPATSFREAKGRNPATNYWFALKGDEARPPFAFAGMWRGVQPGLPEDKLNLLTHTIITTTANEIVRPVHPNRMPVILAPEDYETWMTGSSDEALALLRPFPAEKMQVVREGGGVLKDALDSD